jgi:hypothetical protein
VHPASSAAATDTEANEDSITPVESELYHAELQLMRLGFAGLTHLDYSVSEDEEREGCIEIAAKLVFLFLSTTKILQKLVDGMLQPVSGPLERRRATGSMFLLWNLAHHAPWSHIRNIELEIATNKHILVTFLLAQKNTLRSLARRSATHAV